MVGDWIIAFRRVIVRVTCRRRNSPPHVYRFHADRWHRFRVFVAAFQMETQTLDSVALAYGNQPTLLVLRSSVEGVTYYKARSGADQAPRRLRPFEVTDETAWANGDRPTVVLENPTAKPARVDIFFAVRDEGTGGGGLLI